MVKLPHFVNHITVNIFSFEIMIYVMDLKKKNRKLFVASNTSISRVLNGMCGKVETHRSIRCVMQTVNYIIHRSRFYV